MIHVLHVLEQLGEFGGTPVKLLYQITHASPDLCYTVCCINREGGLAGRFRDEGVEVVALRRDKNYDIRQLSEIAHIITSRDVDIVHTHFARANTYGRLAALLTSRPMITSEHGILRNTTLPLYFFDSVLNLFTNFHISNSYATLRSAQNTIWLNRQNMEVIYNGVPDTFGGSQPETRNRAREYLDIGSDAFVVLDVGSHIPMRDHSTLFRAAKNLSRKIPGLQVIQIGDGPNRKAMEEAVVEYGVEDYVELLGYVERDRVHEYMKAADVYVNPSLLEGFGIATVEAMLAGIPVVCANAGALPELFDEGEHGFLFAPENEAELSEIIQRLHRAPEDREQIGKKARQHALEKFSVKRFVRAFESKYRKMVET